MTVCSISPSGVPSGKVRLGSEPWPVLWVSWKPAAANLLGQVVDINHRLT